LSPALRSEGYRYQCTRASEQALQLRIGRDKTARGCGEVFSTAELGLHQKFGDCSAVHEGRAQPIKRRWPNHTRWAGIFITGVIAPGAARPEVQLEHLKAGAAKTKTWMYSQRCVTRRAAWWKESHEERLERISPTHA
jgi:hypothetical protein